MSNRKPPKKMATLSDEELREFSRKHLSYEIVMVEKVAYLLAYQHAAANPDQTITNLLIESFSVHLRNLIEFLYEDADVKSDLYFADPIEGWRKKRPRKSAVLNTAYQRASKQVQHLTLSRTEKPENKEWPVTEIMKDLKAVLDWFVKHAEPARLDPALCEKVSTINPSGYPTTVTGPSSKEPHLIHTAAPLINTIKVL